MVKFVAVKVGYPSDQLSWDVKKKQIVGVFQSAYCSQIFIFIQLVIALNDQFLQLFCEEKSVVGRFTLGPTAWTD